MREKIFISEAQNQYKANLHSHSTLSDGKLTPKELKEAYKARGYSILAITDHNRPHDHSEMNDEDFLMLTGYEEHIREKTQFDAFAPEIHINLFAKSPSNLTVIGYDARYHNRIPLEELEKMPIAGPTRPREYTVEYVNEFMRAARESGYIVSYNHPWWSLEDEERILSYTEIDSLEIDNSSSELSSGMEHAELLYERMLRRGMRVGCHAGDDNHNQKPLGSPYDSSFLSYTMILADNLDYPTVIRALESKNYYASTGPRIDFISITDKKTVKVKCSPASRIIMNNGSKRAQKLICAEGECTCEAEFELVESAPFFRITVIDEKGKRATSRGYFRDEF